MAAKQRLDLELVSRGLVASRQQAQQLIRAGKVRDGAGTLLDKPGTEVAAALELRVEQPPRFVSRGGEKLLAGLQAFPIAMEGTRLPGWRHLHRWLHRLPAPARRRPGVWRGCGLRPDRLEPAHR